jgi:energy-converting hydrogenase Eha subunit B
MTIPREAVVRILFIVLRLVVAIAGVAAIVTTFVNSSAQWAAAGYEDRTTLIVNFFSYFTIESNIVAAVTLLIGAFVLIRGDRDPGWYGGVRAAAVTYMVITGLVYNLLLRGIPVTGASEGAAWTNEVLHVAVPIYLVVDWFFAPGRRRLEWRQLWYILIFPIVWSAYTLIRGPFVVDQVKEVQGWYPYPFLNPDTSANGYASVVFYVILIAMMFGLVAAGVIWVSRRHERWPLPQSR